MQGTALVVTQDLFWSAQKALPPVRHSLPVQAPTEEADDASDAIEEANDLLDPPEACDAVDEALLARHWMHGTVPMVAHVLPISEQNASPPVRHSLPVQAAREEAKDALEARELIAALLTLEWNNIPAEEDPPPVPPFVPLAPPVLPPFRPAPPVPLPLTPPMPLPPTPPIPFPPTPPLAPTAPPCPPTFPVPPAFPPAAPALPLFPT